MKNLFFTEVDEVIKESKNVVTLVFSDEIISVPGQFLMVSVPGYEEIPLSLSSESSVMVKRVGKTTEKLTSMKRGDLIGIRGPYGRGFEIDGNKFLLIAGGIGIAPLKYLWKELEGDVVLVYGEKSKEDMVDLNSFSGEKMIFTEDGSIGERGIVTDALSQLDLTQFDQIFVCGPEMMMSKVLDILEEQNLLNRAQFSVERYIKCGVGICGSCAMDPHGVRVCVEGPVLSGETLKNSEFGKYYRDASGWRNVWQD